MQNKLLSIIVPVYNTEKYIKKCIDSILIQTYKNFELIIINDGSTDKSGVICDEYSKIDNRIKVIHRSNSGVSETRNIGLLNSNGEYITFLDSDDYIDKDAYEKCLDILLREDVDLIRFSYIKELENYKKAYKYKIEVDKKIQKKEYNEKIYPFIFNTYDVSNIWNMVVRKDIIKDIKFKENIKYGEDFRFMIDVMLKSKSMYFISNQYYHYIINSNSAVHTVNIKEQIKRFNDIVEINTSIIEDLHDKERFKADMENRIIKSYINLIMELPLESSYEEYIEAKEQLNNIIYNNTDITDKKCYYINKRSKYMWYLLYKIRSQMKKKIIKLIGRNNNEKSKF